MLKQLTIRGFKSIRALEDFELGQLTVLIGANGAGKSNFISLFQLLTSLAQRRLQVFVQQQDGPDALLFGGRRNTKCLEAEFHFNQNGYGFSLTPAGDQMIFGEEVMIFAGDRGRHRHALGSGHSEARLPEVTDEPLAEYARSAIAVWRVFHFHDTSTEAPVRQARAVRDNLRLAPDAGNLGPFLRYLRERHSDAYRRITDVVKLAAPFFGDFVYRRDIGERMELEWSERRDPDIVLGARQLSDGTLRFICLVTLLLQPTPLQPDIIVIDEPELGLHPYAIALLADMLRRAAEERQVIVSTQSAELVNCMKPRDVVVVNRRAGESVFERLDAERLGDWLAEYSLAELWNMNILGGRPSR